MKNLVYLSLVILFTGLLSYGQTQQKISWPTLAASPWPMLIGDAQGTGRSEFVGPSTNNVLWRKDMPLGIMFGPVIGYDDELYFGTRAYPHDTTNYFYALSSSGDELWTFPTGSLYSNKKAAVVGSDSTVYIQAGSGYVHAIDKSGNQIWKTGPFLLSGPGLGFSISKYGGLYISTGNDSLLVLDENTGEVMLKKFMKNFFRSSLMVFSPDGNYFYFLNSENGIIENQSLSKSDLLGNIIWEAEFYRCPDSYPVVDNSGNIYCFGTDPIEHNQNALYSFDPDGTLRWKYDVAGFTNFAAPTIDHNGNIIFYSIENIADDPYKPEISVIHSLDYNGNLNWEYIIDPELSIFDTWIDHGLVCDAEGKIYFGSTKGIYFYCLNKDGELLWKLDLEGNEYDSIPAIGSDGTLYLGTHQGSLWQFHTRNLIAIKDDPNSVEDEEAPTEFRLEQNYPNPFNPSTTIKFTLPFVETGHAPSLRTSLAVYDILGREVKTLLNKPMQPGNHEVEFDGSKLTSGVYFYVLQSGGVRISKKMMLVK